MSEVMMVIDADVKMLFYARARVAMLLKNMRVRWRADVTRDALRVDIERYARYHAIAR